MSSPSTLSSITASIAAAAILISSSSHPASKEEDRKTVAITWSIIGSIFSLLLAGLYSYPIHRYKRFRRDLTSMTTARRVRKERMATERDLERGQARVELRDIELPERAHFWVIPWAETENLPASAAAPPAYGDVAVGKETGLGMGRWRYFRGREYGR